MTPRSDRPDAEAGWTPASPPRGWGDLLAILAWTAALVAFFWDAVALRKALFYFDITEINYPYRDFLAGELRLGRFSMWCPGINNGLPLYAESQAGYWHPLKFLLYPWMATWKAFNLDTIGSVWLAGLATYGWLRRHVGPAGALTGGALFGLSGFVWAHLIHTSMINALVSVPLVFWALEASWEGGRARGAALGAVALACQVFAGHLQDTILTAGAVGIYAIYRASTVAGLRPRFAALGFAALLGGLGVAVAAIQWVPSLDLLERSPRDGGLTWEQITYGSWSPELLPTLVFREAFGTLPRDTDWLDGYYPYHEMNAYMGLAGLALAVVGAGAWRDRWVGFWIILAALGGLFMLGRYTALFDFMNRVPVVGSSRIPVRYHLWVSLAVAALAAVGVDRLGRPGAVRLRGALAAVALVLGASAAILAHDYLPIWTDPRRSGPDELEHFRWLGREVGVAAIRTALIAAGAWALARRAAAEPDAARRAWLVAPLPLLVMADLLGSHRWDVPTIDPGYWTVPPASAARILAEPGRGRILGVAERSAAEPGFASRPVNFFEVRDTLAWSLPPVWGLAASIGHTPMYPRRMLTFHDHAHPLAARCDAEAVTHIVSGSPVTSRVAPEDRLGLAFVYRPTQVQARARLMGRPVYVADEDGAEKALDRLGAEIRDRLIVEDPDRPLPADATASGSARIAVDEPERVEVEVAADGPAYLVLADTFDPGWSATVDGREAPIRPAFAGFRAVYLGGGSHRVAFRYQASGFRLGRIITLAGLLAVGVCLAWRRPLAGPDPLHGPTGWPRWWPIASMLILAVFVAGSAVRIGPGGIRLHERWDGSFHRFTWSADIDAIRPMSKHLGR